MNSKGTIKVMFAGGFIAIVVLGVNHFCNVHRAKIEHIYEMEEENLRHQQMSEILKKFTNTENDTTDSNDKNEAA